MKIRLIHKRVLSETVRHSCPRPANPQTLRGCRYPFLLYRGTKRHPNNQPTRQHARVPGEAGAEGRPRCPAVHRGAGGGRTATKWQRPAAADAAPSPGRARTAPSTANNPRGHRRGRGFNPGGPGPQLRAEPPPPPERGKRCGPGPPMVERAPPAPSLRANGRRGPLPPSAPRWTLYACAVPPPPGTEPPCARAPSSSPSPRAASATGPPLPPAPCPIGGRLRAAAPPPSARPPNRRPRGPPPPRGARGDPRYRTAAGGPGAAGTPQPRSAGRAHRTAPPVGPRCPQAEGGGQGHGHGHGHTTGHDTTQHTQPTGPGAPALPAALPRPGTAAAAAPRCPAGPGTRCPHRGG